MKIQANDDDENIDVFIVSMLTPTFDCWKLFYIL